MKEWVRSDPVRSVRPDPVRSDPVRSSQVGHVRSGPVRSGPIRSGRSCPIRSDPIRSDPVRSDQIGHVRSDPVRSDSVRSGPIRPSPVRPVSIYTETVACDGRVEAGTGALRRVQGVDILLVWGPLAPSRSLGNKHASEPILLCPISRTAVVGKGGWGSGRGKRGGGRGRERKGGADFKAFEITCFDHLKCPSFDYQARGVLASD